MLKKLECLDICTKCESQSLNNDSKPNFNMFIKNDNNVKLCKDCYVKNLIKWGDYIAKYNQSDTA